ncbi:MAG: polysaccharide deacetylase family protein [bacterium]|nr:polysaccharide deacetylase family protein [bacterium]
MKKIILRKTYLKKTLPTVLIAAALGYGLFSYDDNKHFLSNFKFYYLQSQAALTLYRVNNLNTSDHLASVLGAFSSHKIETNVSIDQKTAESIPVLTYHGIVPNNNSDNVSFINFKNQMFALKKAGWQTVSIYDLHDFIQGKKKLPEKSFLLTFDDGRKDSYYPVDPLLKALNYRAVIFIITEHSLTNVDSNYYLSKDELKEMLQSGRWDIQAHTKDGHDFYIVDSLGTKGHFYSNKLWLDDKKRLETEAEFIERVTNDISATKNEILDQLGVTAISFAYPFGDFGQESINYPEAKFMVPEITKSIYPISFYQTWVGEGLSFNYPNGNFLIKRISVRPYWSSDNLLKVLDTGREKRLPYADNFSSYNGWLKTYGKLSIEDSSMILYPNSSTGSSVSLDGTYLWQNYIFNAKIDWFKGENISLLARYKDDKNYTTCSFTDNGFKIEQYLNGKGRVMVEKKAFFEMPKKDVWLGIMVNKDKVECLVNGNSVIYAYYLSPVLSHGGIGIKTWDSEVNNSEIVVKNVEVTEVIGDSKDALAQLPKTTLKLKEIPLKNSENPRPVAPTLPPSVSAPQIPEIVSSVYRELSFGNSNSISFDLATSSEWEIKDGVIETGAESLILRGVPKKSSSYFVLGGGYNLTDYKVVFSFDWKSGSSASVLARYKDNKNYMECSFTRSKSGGLATLYIYENGKRMKLYDSPRLILGGIAETSEISIGTSVKRDTISCIFNDHPIITYTLPRMWEKGTFGFKLWDKNIGSSAAELRELNLGLE